MQLQEHPLPGRAKYKGNPPPGGGYMINYRKHPPPGRASIVQIPPAGAVVRKRKCFSLFRVLQQREGEQIGMAWDFILASVLGKNT